MNFECYFIPSFNFLFKMTQKQNFLKCLNHQWKWSQILIFNFRMHLKLFIGELYLHLEWTQFHATVEKKNDDHTWRWSRWQAQMRQIRFSFILFVFLFVFFFLLLSLRLNVTLKTMHEIPPKNTVYTHYEWDINLYFLILFYQLDRSQYSMCFSL